MEKEQTHRSFSYAISAFLDTSRYVIVAIALAELAAWLIYAMIDPATVQPQLFIVTGFITAMVAYPITHYVISQKRKLKRLSQELAFIASVDQMSGLLNRTSFIHAIDEALHTPKAAATGGSFLFIDIDNFKNLNDKFGHSIGDDAIRSVAEAIKAHCEGDAIPGRLGGEEFGIFLPKANKRLALSVAENVRRQVRKIVVKKSNQEQRLSVSIGVSLHKAGQSISTFVQNADEAMYRAKKAGRNKVMFEVELATEAAAPQELKHRA